MRNRRKLIVAAAQAKEVSPELVTIGEAGRNQAIECCSEMSMATTGRDPAIPSPIAASPDEKAKEALGLMVEALELIDSSEGAGVAGAYLDLAIHRLQAWIEEAGPLDKR